MTKEQLQAMRSSLDRLTDEAMRIARTSTNTSNQNINLTAYSIGVMLLKTIDAAIAVTPDTRNP